MDPTQRSRGREIQTSTNEAKIVAVARPQHQPVIAKSNRAVITVNGSVPYVKKSHILKQW